MSQTISYRPIEPTDCDAVAELHRQTFGSKDIEASIFISPRIGHYLAQLVTFPDLQRENWLHSAWKNGQLVGYVFGRALPASWHLNYLGVSPEHQGCGIGQALWRKWCTAGESRGYRSFTVDVERDNERARDWYTRMGYSFVSQTWIYREGLGGVAGPASPARGKYELRNWENACAWQSQYGFSQFDVVSDEATWSIGQLGDKYFRAAHPLPKAVKVLLSRISSSRRLLLMSSHRVARLEELKVSIRLRRTTDKPDA